MPYWESQIDNTWSILRESTPELDQQVYDTLKVRPKGYFFDPRYRTGRWNGWDYYFNLEEKKVLTGMIPFATEVGFEFPETVLAADPLPEFNNDFSLFDPETGGPLNLNFYQQESLDHVRAGKRRGIFDHLTASGKTATMAALISMLRPLRCLVIVPRIELLIQTKDDLGILLQEEIGQLGSGRKEAEPRVVCCYDGFIKRNVRSPFVRELASNTQVLIDDELQTVTPRMFPFFKKCVNAYYRFGFSGSFFDIDIDRVFAVGGYFGGVISSVGDEQTLAAGRTVPPNFTFFQFPLPDPEVEDYDELYAQCIVRNEAYNKFFADKLVAPYEAGKTLFVLVKRIEHCNHFKELLQERHIDCEVYNGRVNVQKRKELKTQFKQGTIPVLIATEQTMGVGTNIPRINLFLDLGAGLSDNLTSQKFGRALRASMDKDMVEIWEPYFTGQRIFLRHSKKRLAVAKRYSTGKVKLVFLNGIEQSM